MPPRLNELGELQIAVLNVLWSAGAATVHEVCGRLVGERRPAYTTVLTVLRNLEKRGIVAHESPDGQRQFIYRPLVSAHDARGDILQDVLQRLFAGSPVSLVRHLLETEGFTIAELQDIRDTLDRQQSAISERRAGRS